MGGLKPYFDLCRRAWKEWLGTSKPSLRQCKLKECHRYYCVSVCTFWSKGTNAEAWISLHSAIKSTLKIPFVFIITVGLQECSRDIM